MNQIVHKKIRIKKQRLEEIEPVLLDPKYPEKNFN